MLQACKRSAQALIASRGAPIVVKTDGLAAGKGVIVAATVEEAQAAARGMLEEGTFGDSGQRIVVEDFLEGEECSFFAVSDGTNVVPLGGAQDHKVRFLAALSLARPRRRSIA